MSFGSAISEFFNPKVNDAQTDTRNEIKSTFFGSKRFVLVIAFVAFIFLTYQLLNIEIIRMLSYVAMTYIIGESLSHVATTIMNGLIKIHEVKTDVDHSKMALENQAGVNPAKV